MKIKNICMIGLGYVGLTLSLVLSEKGLTIYGVEKNLEIIAKLKKKKAHFFEKGLDYLLKKYLNKNFFIAESIPATAAIDAFIITVGTPIDKKTKKPRNDYITAAAKQVAQKLQDGQIVILRSTVAIGTSREVVMPILKKTGKKFYLAFCPERTTEGVALKELKELPQIIGGLNETSIEKAMEIFRKITPTAIAVPSLEDAEMNKVLDNAYRDLTFACANEIALIAKKLGLDGYNVIRAGNLGYPRTNVPIPGFVGGACLEKDPWIFIDCVRKKTKYTPRLIKAAREINEELPVILAERIKENLQERKINKEKAKIFISGFAFKGRPETDDLRGSPTLDLVEALKNRQIKNIYGHDFVVGMEKIKNLAVKPASIKEGFHNADVVIFMNNHAGYENLNIESLLKKTKKGALFFDGWHIYDPKNIQELNHVTYEGIGIQLPLIVNPANRLNYKKWKKL